MRTTKIFNILNQAIIDKPFRETLFSKERKAVEDWDLSEEERMYLKNLPYEIFEMTVGSIFSHWLVPMTVNDRYVILPEHMDCELPDRYIRIHMTESFAFGNGTHATTALCLSALDNYLKPGSAVLDLGTGSGILSIAAALQDAGSVLALDVDLNSVETAKKNTLINAVDDVVKVKQGSIHEAKLASAEPGGFDLVLVNILTPVILSLFEDGLADILKPGSMLAASGIENHEVPLIKRTASESGLRVISSKDRQDWSLVIARKPFG